MEQTAPQIPTRALRDDIEPGLVQLFRLFVGLQVLLVGLWILLLLLRPPRAPLGYHFVHALVPGLLLAYLTLPTLRARLGRAYLPIALGVATVGPVVSYSAVLWLRLGAGVGPKTMLTDAWLPVAALLIPCIFVAWQYGSRYSFGFAALTFTLDLLFNLPLGNRGGPPMATIIAIALVRLVCFLPVGYVVARLVSMLRAERAALAHANAGLTRYLSALDELATSRERNRLARELHDILAHSLSALVIQMEAISALWDTNATRARALLAEALATTRDGMREARRAVAALRATPLEDFGLALALRKLAQATADRAGLELDVDIPDCVQARNGQTEQAIYRIAEEACANVVRHATAKRLWIRLQPSPLTLTISDNGCGFVIGEVAAGRHFGLDGMRERAQLAGGHLYIDSQLGGGTSLRLELAEST